MKRKILFRALMGAPQGLMICIIITICISYGIEDGIYHAVVPSLADVCGNEINAVAIQAILALIYGAVWGGASVIWEMDKWSILRQTLTHLFIVSIVSLPVAYFLQWMEHSIGGVVGYFVLFFGIYAAIWLVLTLGTKIKLSKINKRLLSNN